MHIPSYARIKKLESFRADFDQHFNMPVLANEFLYENANDNKIEVNFLGKKNNEEQNEKNNIIVSDFI